MGSYTVATLVAVGLVLTQVNGQGRNNFFKPLWHARLENDDRILKYLRNRAIMHNFGWPTKWNLCPFVRNLCRCATSNV